MSERDPRAGGRRPDHDEPSPWAEGPGSSVFDRPAAPRPPGRRSHVPPPAAPDPSTLPTQQWPGALYPDQGAYAPTDPGAYPPTDHRGYAPPDHGRYPPPGAYAPSGDEQPPRGRRSSGDPAGRRRDDRPDAPAGGGGRDRSGGRGFPFGLGALFGVAGLGCFLAALVVLPWFVLTVPAGGDSETGVDEEFRLEDIRSSFTPAETDPEDLLADAEPEAGAGTEPGAITVPDGIPTPEELGEAAEDQARDVAATTAASALDEGKARYLELYADTLWMVVGGAVTLAVVFSTILAPRSFALSLLLGFRRAAGAVTVLAAAAHGAALWVVFSGSAAPTPAWGVWLGVGGLAGVLLGCVIGPKS